MVRWMVWIKDKYMDGIFLHENDANKKSWIRNAYKYVDHVCGDRQVWVLSKYLYAYRRDTHSETCGVGFVMEGPSGMLFEIYVRTFSVYIS